MPGMSHRVDSEFVHFVVESLHLLGPVVAKRMFNGHGIFLHNTMFAIVAWDTLYFRVDDQTRPKFEERGLEPFSYADQRGRSLTMPYFEAPPEGIDDPTLLSIWGKEAYQATLRASQAKPTKEEKRRHA